MSREDVVINRAAIISMAHFGTAEEVKGLYREARRSMIRLGLGFADSPAADPDPALEVIDPVGTTPSLIDIIQWMDSIHHDSDSDFDSDSDDDSVDHFEFLSRLYTTLDNRVPPTYKAALIAAE